MTKDKLSFKKLIKNPFAWLAFIVLLYTLVGFFIVPYIVKTQTISYIKETYKREAKIESVSFNPFTFTFSVKGFTLYDHDKSVFLSWEELYGDLNILPLLSKKIELERLSVTKPKTFIKKLNETGFNFSDLVPQQPKAKSKKNSSYHEQKDFKIKYSSLGIEIQKVVQIKNQNKGQWDFIINLFEIRGLNLTFEDKSFDSLKVKINIYEGNLRIHKLHPMSSSVSKFSFNFKMREGGKASASGKFTIEPMYADFKLKADKINFKQTSPYLSKFAYLKLNGGKLNVDGNIKFKMGKEHQIPDLTFLGKAGIDDLILYDTKQNERFLEWNSLTTTGISAKTNPIAVTIGEITLYKLYTRIAIAEDQTINLQKVFKLNDNDSSAVKDSAKYKFGIDEKRTDFNKLTFTFTRTVNILVAQLDSSKSNKNSLANFNFDIGRINIDSSAMFFSDFSLPLKFAAKIHDLNGEIIGISYGNPLGAAVDLEGAVDEYGLARIKGNIDPFDPIGYSDIKMNFNNIELTNLSPYSAKFMGYLIESGKLSLDIQYLLEKGMLNSYSKIFLNKLELGEEVEGHEGFGIPVKLALALLKDGDGNVDLDLEVEGDLNDPEVNTGALVWWAVKRVLVSIVTAPFKLLGNLLGIGGEDLEFIDFDPGESKLLPNQVERLNNINKALNERPGITLEIYGTVDTIIDAQAIRLRKFKDVFTQNMTTAAKDTLVDPLKVEANISRNILEKIYRESFGSSALDSLQLKFTPQPTESDPNAPKEFDLRNYLKEMIAKLADVQPLTNEEMIKLADERKDVIRNHMLTVQQTKPERVVIKETEIHEQEDRNWVKCRLGIGSMD